MTDVLLAGLCYHPGRCCRSSEAISSGIPVHPKTGPWIVFLPRLGVIIISYHNIQKRKDMIKSVLLPKLCWFWMMPWNLPDFLQFFGSRQPLGFLCVWVFHCWEGHLKKKHLSGFNDFYMFLKFLPRSFWNMIPMTCKHIVSLPPTSHVKVT